MAIKSWSTTDADNDDADLSNNIRWTENQAPSTVNNSARAMMTVLKNWWDDILEGTYFISAANTSVTSNAYTLTTTQGIGSLKAGIRICFVAEAANTAAITVNPDSLGATAVKQHGVALSGGEIANGDVVIIVHDGTDFELVYPRRVLPEIAELAETTDDATQGPELALYRNRANPADSDLTGTISFKANDSGGTKTTYAKVLAQLTDVTDTTEDAELLFQTIVNSTLASRLQLGAGLYTTNATSGDQGVDTINASEFYRDGSILVDRFISSGMTITANTAHTFAHSLGAEPDLVQVILQCTSTSTSLNWSVGDRLIISGGFYEASGGDDLNCIVEVDATNVTVHFGDAVSIFDKSTYEIGTSLVSSWDMYVKAFKFAA